MVMISLIVKLRRGYRTDFDIGRGLKCMELECNWLRRFGGSVPVEERENGMEMGVKGYGVSPPLYLSVSIYNDDCNCML